MAPIAPNNPNVAHNRMVLRLEEVLSLEGLESEVVEVDVDVFFIKVNRP